MAADSGTLLSATLTPEQAEALQSGIVQLNDFAAQLDWAPDLNTNLAAFDSNFNDFFESAQTLQFSDALSPLFASSTITTDDVVDALSNHFLTELGVSADDLQIQGGVLPASDDLRFDVRINAARELPVQLEVATPGLEEAGLGLQLGSQQELAAGLEFAMTLGVNTETASEFFVQLEPIELSANLNVGSLDLDVVVGSSEVQIQDGRLALDAAISLQFDDTALSENRLSNLAVPIDTTGSLDATLPVNGHLGQYDLSDYENPVIHLNSQQLFAGSNPNIRIDVPLDQTLQARMLEALEEGHEAVSQTIASEVFQSQIPATGETLSSLMSKLLLADESSSPSDLFELRSVAEEYFASSAPTISGLADILTETLIQRLGQNASGQLSSGPLEITGGFYPDAGQLRLEVQLNASILDQLNLDLGNSGDAGTGISLPEVALQNKASLASGLSFIIDIESLLSGQIPKEEDVSIDFQNLTLAVEVENPDFDASATLGDVELGIEDGRFLLAASGSIGLQSIDGDNRYSLAELQQLSSSQLLAQMQVSASGYLDAELPLNASSETFSDFPSSAFGDATLFLHADPLFQYSQEGLAITRPELSLDLQISESIRDTLISLLQKLDDVAANVLGTSVLNTEIPILNESLNSLLLDQLPGEDLAGVGRIFSFSEAATHFFNGFSFGKTHRDDGSEIPAGLPDFPSLLDFLDSIRSRLQKITSRGIDGNARDQAGKTLRSRTPEFFDFSGFNFQGADLRGMNFSAHENAEGITLPAVRLRKVDFRGADLRGVNFSGLDLRGSDFSGADLRGVNFSGASLLDVDLSGARIGDFKSRVLKSVNGVTFADELILPTDLFGAFFGDKTVWPNGQLGRRFGLPSLPWSGFGSLHRVGANENLSAERLNATSSSLVGFDLSRLDLSGVNFSGVDLGRVSLRDSDLSAAILSGVDLSGALAIGANFSGFQLPSLGFAGLNRLIVDSSTKDQDGNALDTNSLRLAASIPLPDAIPLIANIDLPSFNLSPKSLSGFDLSGLDLSGIDFRGLDLRNVSFASSLLDGVEFGGAGASLFAVDFSGASMPNVSFANPALGFGLDLSFVDFSGVLNFGGTNSSGAARNWSGLKLRSANLSGLDLSGFDLSGANLDGVNVFASVLDGINLSGSSLRGVDLRLAEFGSVQLPDLSGAFGDLATRLPSGISRGEITEVSLPQIFEASEEERVPFTFDAGFADGKLSLDLKVDLENQQSREFSVATPDLALQATGSGEVLFGAGLQLDLGLGIDLSDAISNLESGQLPNISDEHATIHLRNFSASLGAAVQDLEANVSLGSGDFNSLGVNDGILVSEIGGQIVFNEGEEISLEQIRSQSLRELFDFDFTSRLEASLPLVDHLTGLGEYGRPIVQLRTDNLFSRKLPDVVVDVLLTEEAQTEILSGLSRIQDIGNTISSNSGLNTTIPLLNRDLNTLFAESSSHPSVQSVGDVLNLHEVAKRYFDGKADQNESPSAFELAEILMQELRERTEFGAVSISGGLIPETKQLKFALALDTSPKTTVDISLPGGGGVQFDNELALDVIASFNAGVSLTVDLDALTSPGNGSGTSPVKVTVDTLRAKAILDSQDISVGVSGPNGGIGVEGGHFYLEAGIDLELLNGEGSNSFTPTQLADDPVIDFSANGILDAAFPLTGSIGNFSTEDFGSGVILLQSDPLFQLSDGVLAVTTPDIELDLQISVDLQAKLEELLQKLDAKISSGVGADSVIDEPIQLLNQSLNDLLFSQIPGQEPLKFEQVFSLHEAATHYFDLTQAAGQLPSVRGFINAIRARLKRLTSSGIDGSEKNNDGVSFIDLLPGIRNLNGFSFRGADLRGIDFSRHTDDSGIRDGGAVWLRNVDFSGADLRGVNFSGVDLRGANFAGADLRGVNFSGASLLDVNFEGARFGWLSAGSPGNDSSSNILTNVAGALIGLKTRWPSGEFAGRYGLPKLNWQGSDQIHRAQSGSNLSLPKLDLTGTKLAGFDLSRLDLSGVNLSGLDLRGVSLRGTNLTGANLSGVQLGGSLSIGTNFSGVTLGSFSFGGTEFLPSIEGMLFDLSTIMPNGSSQDPAGVKRNDAPSNLLGWLPGMNFSFAGMLGQDSAGRNIDLKSLFQGGLLPDLQGLDLSGVDLSDSIGLDWSGLDFSGVSFAGSILDKINFGSGSTGGSSGSRLFNVNFSGATLHDVSLAGLNLGFADLRRLQFNGDIGSAWLEVNLSGANLSALDLSGFDFAGANLTGSNFDGSILDSVNFNNAVLRGANLAKSLFTGASLPSISGSIVDLNTSLPTALPRREFIEVQLPDILGPDLDEGPSFEFDGGFDAESQALRFSLTLDLEKQETIHFDVATPELALAASGSGQVLLGAELDAELEFQLGLGDFLSTGSPSDLLATVHLRELTAGVGAAVTDLRAGVSLGSGDLASLGVVDGRAVASVHGAVTLNDGEAQDLASIS
ncbi:MAG: pentapeptide repeat-containing protein, partial [Planctomycetota bacterium]